MLLATGLAVVILHQRLSGTQGPSARASRASGQVPPPLAGHTGNTARYQHVSMGKKGNETTLTTQDKNQESRDRSATVAVSRELFDVLRCLRQASGQPAPTATRRTLHKFMPLFAIVRQH